MSVTLSHPTRRPVAPLTRPAAGPSFGRIMSAILLAGVPASALGLAVARGGFSNPWVLPLMAMTLVSNVIVVMMDIKFGLVLFILTAGLSPKLPGIYNNLRVEDFIFVLVFGVWLSRALQSGKLPPLRNPMMVPFATLTAMSVASSLYGLAIGTIPDIPYSIFLQLKRIEYLLIFWVVFSSVKNEGWLRVMMLVFVASGAVAAMYGLANPQSAHQQSVAEMRVSGPEGENYNTLSGYLVICIGAGLSVIPVFRKPAHRALVIGSIGLAAAALLFSFSREGYVMLAGVVLVFGFTKNRGVLMGAVLALVAVAILAPPVQKNINNTIRQIQNAKTDDPGSNSLTARYLAWDYRYNGWFVKQPLLGNGVGSIPLSVDNEYLLRACEIGIVGLIPFFWWLASIGKMIRRYLAFGGLPRAYALGLAAAFVGMLIQGTVATSFNTIRTMEPFWFLLGLVAASATIRQRALQEEKQCVS